MSARLIGTFCAMALVFAPQFSTAADFTVSNAAEFQAALTTAQANGETDTINVGAATFNVLASGTLTYTAAATENFGLVITGGAQALGVLDGGSQVPILRLDSTAVINDGGVYFEVRNLTFRNGNASSAPNEDGGALAILTDDTQQPAEFATVIFISGCEFFDNAAAGDGGAVYVRAHAVEGIYLDDLTFDRNQAGGNGGSAFIAGGLFTTPVILNNIDFFNGMAQGSGGGLVVEGFDAATPNEDLGTSVQLTDILFYNNQSMDTAGGGGGADVSSLTVLIDSVGFVDNQATVGGGLRIRPSWSTFAMVNTGFTGNIASQDGGGFAALDAMFQDFIVTNNTIFANTANNRGGGAFIRIDGSASIAEIYNNIIYGNVAAPDSGGDLWVNNRAFEDLGAAVELFNNDISSFVVAPVAVTAGSNIDQAPSFVDMASRPQPDPRLQPGSAGIDVGDDAAPAAPAFDFEGDSRPFDGDGDMTATIDMGMDEFTGAAVQNADLGVTKSDNPDPVTAGGEVTYTIVVTNNGPGAASNVTLTDVLDELVAYVSATPGQGTCSALMGTVTCSLGTLANGASTTATVVVATPDVLEQTQITNQASVSASEPDPVAGNDSATEQTTVVPAGAPIADLAVTKADSPDPILFDGSTVTYTITVTNNGPDAATGVTVSDALPTVGAQFQSASTSTGQCDAQPDGNGVLECTIGDLAVDGTATVTVVILPTGILGPALSYNIANTVTVSGNEGDPASANNTATAETTVNLPAADMRVGITATPAAPMIGSQISYGITVANDGPIADTGVVLTVTLPASVTLDSVDIDQGSCDVAGNEVACAIGDMAVGATVGATIIVTAPAEPGMLTLSATVAGDVSDPVLANNTDSEAVMVIENVDLVIQGTSEGTGSFGPGWLILLMASAGLTVMLRRQRAAGGNRAGSLVLLTCLVPLIGALPTDAAHAQDGWYIAASLGSLDLDYAATDLERDLGDRGWTITDVSVRDTGTAWKVVGGFAFNEYFALEAGFVDLGKVTTRYGTSIPPDEIDAILNDTYDVHPIQGDGWVTTAVVRWPISQSGVSLLARAGLFYWESDLDVRVITGGTGSVSGTESGSDGMYGIGLEWQLNADWALTAGWERYRLDEWLDVPMIGIRFSF